MSPTFVVVILSQSEIFKAIRGGCFTPGHHDVLLGILSIHEGGKAENASRIRSCQIGVELSRHSAQEVLGLILPDVLDFPYDLKFRRRSFKDIIWCRHATRASDRFEGLRSMPINIEIQVPDFLDVLFGSALSIGLKRVHADVHVGGQILVSKPELKIRRGRIVGRSNALNRFRSFRVSNEDCHAVGRFEVFEDVFRRRDFVACRAWFGAHAGSFSVEKSVARLYSSASASKLLISITSDTNRRPGRRSSWTTELTEWPMFVLMARYGRSTPL